MFKCNDCNGTGEQEYDDGADKCIWCEGRGWVFLGDRLWDIWYTMTVPIACRWERLQYTRLGCWWWERRGRYRNARRIARHLESEFQGHARCGHRLNQLRQFILLSEHTQDDISFFIDKQRRMVWEMNEATRLAGERERAA